MELNYMLLTTVVNGLSMPSSICAACCVRSIVCVNAAVEINVLDYNGAVHVRSVNGV